MKFYTSEPAKKISEFAKEYNFESLRPYYDSESPEVMKRISNYEYYQQLMAYLNPNLSKEEAIEKAVNTKSPYEFQTHFMSNAIWTILNQTSTGLTWSGLDKLDKNTSYLYIANHRDILLDSAILQIILDKEEFETSEITFGENLMQEGFITDFGKMNRMVAVKRDGTIKELYDTSKQLSAYIRHTILDKKVSMWIAQRNGRTKDGNDITQTGVVKMLNLSGTKDFKHSITELNIVPITISYEYDTCDKLKVQELYLLDLQGTYVKAKNEDFNSILAGIKQPKGKIHVAFGTPIFNELDEINKLNNDNEKIKLLTNYIDKQIHQNYKLNPVNYIAYDILNQTNIFKTNYTENEKNDFINYTNESISELVGEQDVLRNLFIKLYANPIKNKL